MSAVICYSYLIIYNDSFTEGLKIYLCHGGTDISKFSVIGLWNNTGPVLQYWTRITGARRLHQVSAMEPQTLRPAPLFAALPGAAILY